MYLLERVTVPISALFFFFQVCESACVCVSEDSIWTVPSFLLGGEQRGSL